MTLTELIKDRTVRFLYFRDGQFIYGIMGPGPLDSMHESTHTLFQFPVPLDDIGTATLKAEDKAIYFMRWISKALIVRGCENIIDIDKTEKELNKCGDGSVNHQTTTS